jgi:hypothetical protein
MILMVDQPPAEPESGATSFLGFTWYYSKGSIIKFLRCEQCGKAYAYEMLRGADGETFRSANMRLRSKLERSCDPVPCPDCGWYQQEMVHRLRMKHLAWLQLIAQALVLISIAVLVVLMSIAVDLLENPGERRSDIWYLLPWVGWVVTLAAAGALFILRKVLCDEYDPNDESVEVRKRQGRARALGRISLEEIQRQVGPLPEKGPPEAQENRIQNSPDQVSMPNEEIQEPKGKG